MLALSKRAEPCNGHASLCSKRYNEVSYACTHNSYSYPPPNAIEVLNQEHSIQQQLTDGIRAFMLDLVRPELEPNPKTPTEDIEAVHLCHASCILIDKGTLETTLKIFKDFMDKNPHEVITFIIENFSEFSVDQVEPSFKASGIDKYAYIPEFQPNTKKSGYKWPTLKQMIDKDKRLMVFMDDKADVSKVPYILPEWEYVIETPFENISPVKQFPCSQDRPRDGKPRDLLVMNHFAYNRANILGKNIDTPLTASQINKHGYNAAESLQQQVDTCNAVWGSRVPNFITVDYYNVGKDDIFGIVNKINGV
ncbi:hypothetical protein J3B02_003621 [Coemansia erecta]|uniref:PLC-like phosphodiesterase n=1 Tax=Coemansia asiatica TaxID=1052880 RepID=A0A9W7XJ76_9FUNG|nr:hypothetical protein LPJ64_004400 [Coemansia asiatica]KAJ2850880.1 hypothetical protein J3B02_003621 [Coemansia erecta]